MSSRLATCGGECRMGRGKTRSYFTRFAETHPSPRDDMMGFAEKARSRRAFFLLYPDCMSLPLKRRLTLDVYFEGCPGRPGRASHKEGESWNIIAKLSLGLIPQN